MRPGAGNNWKHCGDAQSHPEPPALGGPHILMLWPPVAGEAKPRPANPTSCFTDAPRERTTPAPRGRSQAVPSDRAARFAALTDDVNAFRHYIQAERGL